MTTIHYTPPPDDASKYVLAWHPQLPDRWHGLTSDHVRRHWGARYTAWCEQPPLPTPEPEPVPLRVGMEVWGRHTERFGVVVGVLDDSAWVSEAHGVAYRWLADELYTTGGRPVCQPDVPAPVDRQTAEVIVERFVNVLQAEADSARARYPQDSPAIRHGTAALDHGIRALRSVDLSDLPDPAKSYTAEQIERAFRGEGANDAEIVPLLAALRDGEGTP